MNLRVNLKQISAFRLVMITGSTIEAAALLKISQPAVSRLIQNFEAQVDFELFIRQSGRLHPTPEAEALFREVEQVYSGLNHLNAVIRNIHLLESGILRIVVTTPFAQKLLPDVLKSFRQLHPNARISIRTVVKREMPKWLESQQFDVALVTFPVDYPPTHMQTLGSFQGVCVMSPEHVLATLSVIHAKDLINQPFISIIPDTQLRVKVDEVFEKMGIQRHLLIETQSGASICSLVAMGLGISIVDPLTASALAGKGLVMKPFLPAIPFEFGLLQPLHRPPSSLVQDFISTVHDQTQLFKLHYLDP